MGKSRHSKSRDHSIDDEHQQQHNGHNFIQRSKQKKLIKALKTKDLDLLLSEEDEDDASV